MQSRMTETGLPGAVTKRKMPRGTTFSRERRQVWKSFVTRGLSLSAALSLNRSTFLSSLASFGWEAAGVVTGTESGTAGRISSHPTQRAGRPAFIPRVSEKCERHSTGQGTAPSAVIFANAALFLEPSSDQGGCRARWGED